MVLSENAGDGFDYSYIWCPSIDEHEQNSDGRPWLMLVSLMRDSFLALAKVEPSHSRALVDHWRASQIPLLRRFVFFAAVKTNLVAGSEMLDLLLEQNHRWLWSPEVEREGFQLLRYAWFQLGDNESTRLVQAILGGPPRSMFRADTSADTYLEITDEMVWRRLECLDQSDRILPRDAQERLIELRHSRPSVERPDDRADFPSYTTTVSGDPIFRRIDPHFDLGALSEEEQSRIVEGITPESPYWRSWQMKVREDISGAFEVLATFSEGSTFPGAAWKEFLHIMPMSTQATPLWPRLCSALIRWLDLSSVSNEVASVLRDVSKSLAVEDEDCFWVVWDRLLPSMLEARVTLRENVLSQALNSASGMLAEAILQRMEARNPNSGTDLTLDIWERLTKLAQPIFLP